MNETSRARTLAAGEAAPAFDLPLVEPEGRATLADYVGKRAFMLALFRGIACPFCRRMMATTKQMADGLEESGVAVLAVTSTPLKAARLYARYRPAGLRLASDPFFGVHRTYGVPVCELSETGPTDWPRRVNMGDVMATPINPTGELPEALPGPIAGRALDKLDGFEEVQTGEERAPPGNLALTGFFLIDRDGIVRWTFIEATEDVREYGKHPNREEVIAAARALAA